MTEDEDILSTDNEAAPAKVVADAELDHAEAYLAITASTCDVEAAASGARVTDAGGVAAETGEENGETATGHQPFGSRVVMFSNDRRT
jgi:hypothetical protein